jgi:Rad52/22 family double-strand break repair protein
VAKPIPTEPNEIKRITQALAAPFDSTEVRFKPQLVKGNRAMAIAYIDARAIQDRLDDVLGVEGWQDEYTPLDDGSVICKLRLKIGDEWITKMDVGSESEQPDGGDRKKAAFSDALKRAAVKFGVGRYLYRLPQTWVDYDPQKKQIIKPPQLPALAQSARPARPARPAEPPADEAKPAKVEPKPARADNRLPANGQELRQRLMDYDGRLSVQGLCPKGALVQHVLQAGVKAGFGADIGSWNGPAITLAVEETRRFDAQLKQQPRPQEKAVA